MTFLDEQMDRMLIDPAADQQFLGNTFKWWASFLNAEEGATPLDGRSLPICLVHGIEDAQIPVHSADLTTEMLSTTNPLYLRLEGYGHDYDFGNGLSGSVETGGSINTDRDGNTSKEAHVEVQGSFKF